MSSVGLAARVLFAVFNVTLGSWFAVRIFFGVWAPIWVFVLLLSFGLGVVGIFRLRSLRWGWDNQEFWTALVTAWNEHPDSDLDRLARARSERDRRRSTSPKDREVN